MRTSCYKRLCRHGLHGSARTLAVPTGTPQVPAPCTADENALKSCCPLSAGAFLATTFTLGRKDNLHKVLLWVHKHTIAGLVIFALLYVWFTVMFLPPALLAACAGALYGLLKAIPVVWFCAVVSNAL